ncbi:MAG: nitroreductase family protein [Oscillospiraceae bacterium]|nr:nitroreductase family protein [Oscillospiraceae bacterium]
MNYRALIENRKSVREFADKQVSEDVLESIVDYFQKSCKCLDPQLKTELYIVSDESGRALEGAAGYNSFLIGAPQYLVLLSENGQRAPENAGFMMEDLLLKLAEENLDSCWMTFTDSEAVKRALELDSRLDVMAVAAFGYGVKAKKRIHLNILSMSNVDIIAKRRFFEPKRGIRDMVFLQEWGNTRNVEEHIGFYDDMLWEAFYAASKSPSYLNRQAYDFVIHEGKITLVARPDAYTTELDGRLSLGVVLLHFSAVAEQWAGKVQWSFDQKAASLPLPDGFRVVATWEM